MCNFNWACSLNVRYIAQQKSRAWQLQMETVIYPLPHFHSSSAETNMASRWINLPGRPPHTQNSQQPRWVCQVPLGAGWMYKKQAGKRVLSGLYVSVFCKTSSYINAVTSVTHTSPACHPRDHQVPDRYKTDPRTPLSSYSRTTPKCWRTLPRFRTRSGCTHSHPDHICKGIDRYIVMHGSGEVDLHQSGSEE